jgi:lipopolysaccharide export system ATP-binding protein
LAVLLTDHAVREAMQVCDRVVLIDAGRVLVAGTPGEVAADPEARRRFLGEAW